MNKWHPNQHIRESTKSLGPFSKLRNHQTPLIWLKCFVPLVPFYECKIKLRHCLLYNIFRRYDTRSVHFLDSVKCVPLFTEIDGYREEFFFLVSYYIVPILVLRSRNERSPEIFHLKVTE